MEEIYRLLEKEGYKLEDTDDYDVEYNVELPSCTIL